MSEQSDVPVTENVSDKRQATDPRFNMEPVLIEVPGTPYAREMQKWERPYQYRPFPKMVYRAERHNGSIKCGEPEPQPWEFKDERSYRNAIDAAREFTNRCQRTVNDEVELSRAMEAGFREHPDEAVKHCDAREAEYVKQAAHTNHDDRNLSERAKAEKSALEREVGEPLAEVQRSPVRRTKKVA